MAGMGDARLALRSGSGDRLGSSSTSGRGPKGREYHEIVVASRSEPSGKNNCKYSYLISVERMDECKRKIDETLVSCLALMGS